MRGYFQRLAHQSEDAHSEESNINSLRVSGRFFMSLAALSAVLSCFALHSKEWWRAVTLLAITLFFGLIGWVAFPNTIPSAQREGGSGDVGGDVTAGCPVPVKPSPTHHLAGAKDLPPSEKVHSLAKD
jgi:hypothetical protein